MANSETKREKFVRLVEARTSKIINMVQLLGNCSNQSQYEYTQKDVDKIFKAIQTELDEAKKRFSKQDCEKGNKFSLD
jgi:Fe-S cluster biogenesis protein NfuA